MVINIECRWFKSHWDRHGCRGRMGVTGQKRDVTPWTTSVEEYGAQQIADTDVPIYRHPSTYPGAGLGMFAARALHRKEIVVEYTGTYRRVTPRELSELMDLHANDGNGLVEVSRLHPLTVKDSSTTPSSDTWIIDPYQLNGHERILAEAQAVWANHRCEGDVGCNLQLL